MAREHVDIEFAKIRGSLSSECFIVVLYSRIENRTNSETNFQPLVNSWLWTLFLSHLGVNRSASISVEQIERLPDFLFLFLGQAPGLAPLLLVTPSGYNSLAV